MKETYNLSELGSFTRARQIVGAVILFAALTLAASPTLWGQCQQGIASVTLDRASIIAGASGPTGTAQGTLRLNCPDTVDYYIVYIYLYDEGQDVYQQQLCYFGNIACYFSVSWGAEITAPITLTVRGNIWPSQIWGPPVPLVVYPGPPETGGNLGVCPSGNSCVAGSPINLTDGNTWIEHRDYSVPGLGGGLQLSRVWNSRWGYATPPTLSGMFGYGWRSTYEEMLAGPDANNNITYWRGDGSGWTFNYNSVLGTYSLTSPPNVRATLVSNPATGIFTLTFADGTQRVFNSQNLLAAIIDRNHNQTTIAYDGSNRIASVTSPGGGALTFSYNDPNNVNQATSVQDSVGTVATYTYDSSSRLTLVTYPDGSALNFAYDANSNVLSVTDVRGKLLEAHTYDSQSRGLTSTRANGVDSVSLTY